MKKDILTAKIIKKHLQQIVRREFFDIVIALPIWGLLAASVAYLGYGFLKNRFGLGETGALIVALIPAIIEAAILIFKFFTALHKALLIHFDLYTVILDKVTGCGYEEGARTFDTFFFHNLYPVWSFCSKSDLSKARPQGPALLGHYGKTTLQNKLSGNSC